MHDAPREEELEEGRGGKQTRGRVDACVNPWRQRRWRREQAASEKSSERGRRVSGTSKGRAKEGAGGDEATTCGSQSRINYRSVSVHEAGP